VSRDFPGTANALQPNRAGGQDVFIAVLAPTRPSNEVLRYSTYIGQPWVGFDTTISDQLVHYDGLTLSMVTWGPLAPVWTPPGKSFFDDTFNGATGRANLLVLVLPVTVVWGENQPASFAVQPSFWSYFWEGLGSYNGGDAFSTIEALGEGDVVLDRVTITVASVRGTDLRDGLPDNYLPVGPAGVLQLQASGDLDLHVGKYVQFSPYPVPNRASSAQLTVVGQGSVVSSVWDWDGPTPLRFNQAGPGTQSITTASQRPFLNQLVWLAATPSPGWTFQGWSGDCTGTTPTIQVTVDQNFACTATFVLSTPATPTPPPTPTPTPTPVPKPDLVVSALDARPRAARGGPLRATVTVRNQGTAPAPASTVALLFSADPTPSADDLALGTCGIGPLGVGQEASCQVTVRALPRAPQHQQGYLVAVADWGNVVVELNEANNTLAQPFLIQ
jgi:uncharacterized repeat protein (TIGR02543 family)